MKYMKIRDVKSPERGTDFSAGLDFFVPNDFKAVSLQPGHDILIPSGIKMRVPDGCMLMAADKSGVATSAQALIEAGITPKATSQRSSLIVGAKIIDEDYTGEIHMHIFNAGSFQANITPGMKITQFIVVPILKLIVEEVKTEAEVFPVKTARGSGGFGSTNG
jgi:dUTP pyrophosphatase